MMSTEVEWVRTFITQLNETLGKLDGCLQATAGQKLPYAYEVQKYDALGRTPAISEPTLYETDILVAECAAGWVPRVVVETKLSTINSHDAITYSHKASTHKHVHPYLRYGVLLGDREHHPLPGRLFRHGAHFDFLLSWVGNLPTETEFEVLVDLLIDEVNASRRLQEMIYSSRSRKRQRYVLLRRKLECYEDISLAFDRKSSNCVAVQSNAQSGAARNPQ